ncbi:MAG TPA: T9SS type A sorting domain-containing protein [Bacteroidetes bacterium]|nr:T9SS type A sorting domain-containing protein [Bacteroidota bacterium]
MRTSFMATLVLLLAGSYSLFSQSNPWTLIPESALSDKSSSERPIVPDKYKTLQLNLDQVQALLRKAPLWQTEDAKTKNITLALPMPDGNFEQFRIEYAPVMHPDLAARYPMIRSYAGVGIDDPTAYLRFDFTQKGFHAYIRSGHHGDVFIDPYSNDDIEHYISYFKKDFFKDSDWQCSFDEVNDKKGMKTPGGDKMAGDCQLRTYRLALACTGEYAAFHGGTTAGALAAMNTTMTRVNGIFENDASITMTLVPNTDQLIFLNANTDPYTNNSGSAMLSENQTTCDNVIGSANYDIGHVFSTGGGGVAYLRSPCGSSKAGGVTGQPNPVGDPFDVDYVAHEMGHQYGANHTQNNNCNRNSSTAMEPGSASTIMGYAGICAPDVQAHSDAYYHAISLQEMANFVTGSGNACAVTTSTGNNAPTANAGSNYTIPKSTTFVLSGIGSDPDPDNLTYCWEQMDNQVATMPPSATSTGGPAFRSLSPTASPDRYFPNLTDIVNNASPTWEVLASVGRTYNFRMTVRDNHAGGGCTAEDNMVVTVSAASGPFLVTAPNTAVTWPALSNQTITWDVAGTTAAPVSAANVDIFLSTDGGFTYPVTLASNTPNDGSQTVAIPNNPTTQARVMVKGANNIFFDISNTDFTIGAPLNGFTVNASPNAQTVCAPADAVFTVDVGAAGGFTGNVSLSANGVPAGASASFSTNPVAAPGTSQLTISGTASVTPGTYNITVTGVNGADTQSETVALTIIGGAPGAVTLSSPANGATGVSQTPTLSWGAVAAADNYDVQLASDAGFTNLIVNQTGVAATSYSVASGLTGNTTYYWRVRSANGCGTSAYSAAFSFTTANITCNTFASANVPISISSSGTPTVTSTLTVAASGTIDDLNVLGLDITHTWINDLIVTLQSPAGTQVTLINRICNSENNILTNFDDESANPHSAMPCPPTNNGTYQPNSPLSAFDGEDQAGTWTLTIQDVANQDGGSLNAWSLEICASGGGNPPLVVTASGTNVSCNGAADGTATASATGGTGTYTYAWSNGGTTQTITNLGPGSYSVTVTSGTDTQVASTTISQPTAVVATATGNDTTCGMDNGSAAVSVSGGTAPYTYLWSNGATTASISALAAGTYGVTATDAGGCTGTANVTIGASSGFTASATATDASCSGVSNGSATASPTGGAAPFSYAWSNGGTTQTINNLAAGTYNVTVTDNNGCVANASATVNNGAGVSITVSGTDAACSGATDGTATATPSGGTAPYSYAWSNGGTAQTISGLAAGTYTATVTDANGCNDVGSVTIGNGVGVTITVTGTDAACSGATDGTATATPSGGTSPYSYAWSNGGNTQTISGLAAGTYTATVTDANGCNDVGSVTINNGAGVSITVSGTDAACSQASNGTATATPSGGTAPYSYAWSNGGNTQTISGLAAGTYTATVTDANGCNDVGSVTINNGAGVALSASATNVSCNGGSDGTASATPSGGTAPFSYLWSNGATTQAVTGLAAGSYSVVVTDANGCTASANATVVQPSAMSVNVTGTNPTTGSTGSATANATGGTPPYSFVWNIGATSQTIANLPAGTYSVTVADANGCTQTGSITLTETGGVTCGTFASTNVPVFISASGTPTVTSTLNVSATGTIDDVNVLGLDITHTWINDLIITLESPSGTQVTLINRICGSENNILTNFDDASANPHSSLPCPPTNNGTYQPDSPLSAFFGENPSGTWTLIIQDVFNQDGGSLNGWSLEICSDPNGTLPLAVAVTGVDPTGGNDGSATATPSGGTPPYSYAWSNGGTAQTITGLAAGTYGVTVTDANSATATGSVTLVAPGTCTYSTINDEDFEGGWGIWNDGGSDCRRYFNASYANSGNYSIRLRDNTSSSVMTTDNMDLSVYEELTVDFSYYVRSFDNSSEDFWLQVSTNGGSTYTTVEEWNLNDEFLNNQRKFDAVVIPGPFTSNTRLRFRCDASGNSDWVYIDDVLISGCAATNVNLPQIVAARPNTEKDEAELLEKEEFELLLYPNPARESIQLEYTQLAAGAMNVAVYDMLGKIVFAEKTGQQKAGEQRMQLDISALQAGHYILQLTDGTERKAVQFVKVE